MRASMLAFVVYHKPRYVNFLTSALRRCRWNRLEQRFAGCRHLGHEKRERQKKRGGIGLFQVDPNAAKFTSEED